MDWAVGLYRHAFACLSRLQRRSRRAVSRAGGTDPVVSFSTEPDSLWVEHPRLPDGSCAVSTRATDEGQARGALIVCVKGFRHPMCSPLHVWLLRDDEPLHTEDEESAI